ncbi:ATP-binding cassette domain-containing protein [Sorangium sp. So ce1000]|uniref:ATP-binding cassette domain-containing protein n=1 Tax=Sorangium sp. So ce1000 TaxID=3133325 RepID=UPI003F613AF5
MSADLHALAWPAGRLGEAMEALGRAAGLPLRAVPPLRPVGVDLGDADALGAWIEHAAAELGVEAEPASEHRAGLLAAIRRAAPALVRAPAAPGAAVGAPMRSPEPGRSAHARGEAEPRFFVLARGAGRSVVLLAPDGAPRRVAARDLADLLAGALEEPLRGEVDGLLERAGVAGARLARARRALLDERLGAAEAASLWLLRLPPGASLWRRALEARLPRRAVALLSAHAASYGVWLFAWWLAGRGVLEDRLDRGWLLGWALMLLSIVPLRLLGTWSSGLFALEAGALLKQRLLAGALALSPEEVRREGVGRLLGRVIESEAVESLALGGGVTAVTAAIELAVSAIVLGQGAGGALHPLLLAACVGAGVALAARYLVERRRWTEARLSMTHELVERMVGQRTRLAQEPRADWHAGEDAALAGYLDRSRDLDGSHVRLSALVPGMWTLAGVLGLVPAFLAGSASPASLAVALGGVLLAASALKGLLGGLSSLSGAAIAWKEVDPLFRAAARAEPPPPLLPPRLPRELSGEERAILSAHDVVFRHAGRARPVLRGATLQIAANERVLLEGPSGGGKSTLAALLAGLRAPESGLLLLGGFDRATLGASGWRRRVAAAPQFHENHVLTASFAFNLLMSRRWPPRETDLAEAQAICGELGLGELLSRMPSGFEQMVGETGWQLSHGEKSRLYMARALLQGADVVVLDESLAALDPETMQRALACAVARSKALIVVAHP